MEYKVVLDGAYGCFMWSIKLFYVEYMVVLGGV